MAHKKKNRLTSILVEEISLVDRAANDRKYLVTKRAKNMLVSDGRGGFIEKAEGEELAKAEKAKAEKEAAEKEAAEKAKGKNPFPPKEEDEETKAKAKKAAEEKEAAEKAAAEKTEKADRVTKLTAMAARVVEVAKMDDLPESFEAEISGMAKEIATGHVPSEMEKLQSELDQLKKAQSNSQVSAMESEIASLKDNVRKMSEQPGAGNSRTPEGEKVTKSKTDVVDGGWPSDMNSPVQSKEEAEKNGTSFY